LKKRIRTDPVTFVEVEKYASRYDAAGRTASAAFLIWFLETVYRLDEIEAEDSVCDRSHDEGFDAIVANDLRQEIVVFQANRREKPTSTLGDVDLKKFVGSLKQLKSESSARKLIEKTPNIELKTLLTELKVPEKLKSGYKVRPIFVCNVSGNEDAKRYMELMRGEGVDIDLWDLTRLDPVIKQLSRDWFVTDEAKLSLIPSQLFFLGEKSSPNIVYAAIKAKELVRLPGIEDCRIFAQNVRLGLGNTRVNDDILETVKHKKEHPDFITFHNGLTIVAKKIYLRGGKIRLKDFSVCNGCQSLLAFYNNRSLLTDNFQVLVRVVKVGDDRRLSEMIAYRTNNQNPISLRDLSSNDTRQVRLKAEFDDLFGDHMVYAIKRGEKVAVDELPNEYAGRLILSLYVREPWSAHQKYRIFGDLETKIFSYDISAAHIKFVYLLAREIEKRIGELENKRMAKYALTKYILNYIIGEIIRLSPDGKKVLENPINTLSSRGKANPSQEIIVEKIGNIVDWTLTEMNYVVKAKGGEAYDYKREFKSPKAVENIRDEIVKAFEKDIYRGRSELFTIKRA